MISQQDCCLTAVELNFRCDTKVRRPAPIAEVPFVDLGLALFQQLGDAFCSEQVGARHVFLQVSVRSLLLGGLVRSGWLFQQQAPGGHIA